MKKSFIVMLLCLFNATAFGQNAADFNETLKAAQQGHAEAQFGLGFMYLNGLGVRQNTTQAKAYFRQACDGGLQDGCDYSQAI